MRRLAILRLAMLIACARPPGESVFVYSVGDSPCSVKDSPGSQHAVLGSFDGSATGASRAADQDFDAATQGGRLDFEAELDEGDPSQVYVVEPMGEVRTLTANGSYATLCAVLE